MKDFSNIKTRRDVSKLLNIPLKKLTHTLYFEKNLYTKFDIGKKSGEPREILAPNDDLKKIQKQIYRVLDRHILAHRMNNKHLNISHGFEREKSIISNSEIHKNKRYVFNTDIKDFFTTIHFGRVKGYFMKNKKFKMQENIATIIAQLVCHEGILPQGAPTSPLISNLICNILDLRLLKVSKEFKLNYTRYADDLTFSTNSKNFLERYEDFYSILLKEISKAGFSINDKKNRLQYKDSQQVVTGLTVNDKVNVKRTFYTSTRAMAYSLYTKGSFTIDGEVGTIQQLEGRFSFINQLDKHNNIKEYNKVIYQDQKIEQIKTFFKRKPLNAREKEYQKFIFYKHFWNNECPLIVTEGKTDVLYIKAALKKYYLDYPNLIQLNEHGAFEYKIDFFQRTKKLRYFFELDKDGADTMQKIINYYIPSKISGLREKTFNYLDFFYRKIKREPTNPIILLFDNERKGSPLHKFINNVQKHVKPKGEDLKDKLNKPIPDPQPLIGNIHLMSVPRDSQSEEGEIEDLLNHITNILELHGKKFNRNGGDDFFGKEILSKYINKEYNSLELDTLKPILDRISNLKTLYSNKL